MSEEEKNTGCSGESCSSEGGCSGNCSSCSGCHDDHKLEQKMAQIGRKIIVMSGKGGVGKSSVAAAIALKLPKAGRSIAARIAIIAITTNNSISVKNFFPVIIRTPVFIVFQIICISFYNKFDKNQL